jgi:hypothetical protein
MLDGKAIHALVGEDLCGDTRKKEERAAGKQAETARLSA